MKRERLRCVEVGLGMEMVASAEIGIGEDLTPPLSPLSFSLHDSFLVSHCASCFSPLPPNPLSCPLFFFYYYCSPFCASSHPPLHLHHLLRLSSQLNHLPFNFNGETSDLRLALLLLLHIKTNKAYDYNHDRLCGLMANRHKLLDDEFSLSARIKNGARAIAMAMDSDDSSLLEEAVLCVVVTNAVEVQDRVGRPVGIAVYDISFSWINHSCSPNAWYRFLPPPPDTHAGTGSLLIRPASSSSNGIQLPIDDSDFPTGIGRRRGGPRLVVRSIKQIKKGEQVTIAYTDLLQPKESRQLELWSKYRFTCCCHRCVAVPLTYVDHCLQQVSTSGGNLFNDVGVEESLKEYVDGVIHDYLSSNDAESCCTKLENVLVDGFLYEQEQVVIRLHPQHHLSLNAYTTLASAYKVRARAMDDENALKMNRFSAAYSLLLALLTHPFFLSESCLIACVSNFWIGAGESLLNLARSLKGMYHSGSDLPSFRCSRCGLSLMDVFKDGCNNKVSNELLLHCSITSNITPKVWELLIYGNGCLEAVRDPTIDLFSNNNQNLNLEGITTQGVEEDFVFQVGVHCLLYGGILSNINGGHDSHFSCYVRSLVS